MSEVAAAFFVLLALATVSTYTTDGQSLNAACAVDVGSLRFCW